MARLSGRTNRSASTYESWQKDHRKDVVREQIFKTLTTKQSIFLMSNYQKNGWHCIRFGGVKDDDTIFAMVPVFGLVPSTVEEISIQNLIDWDYSFAVIQIAYAVTVICA